MTSLTNDDPRKREAFRSALNDPQGHVILGTLAHMYQDVVSYPPANPQLHFRRKLLVASLAEVFSPSHDQAAILALDRLSTNLRGQKLQLESVIVGKKAQIRDLCRLRGIPVPTVALDSYDPTLGRSSGLHVEADGGSSPLAERGESRVTPPLSGPPAANARAAKALYEPSKPSEDPVRSFLQGRGIRHSQPSGFEEEEKEPAHSGAPTPRAPLQDDSSNPVGIDRDHRDITEVHRERGVSFGAADDEEGTAEVSEPTHPSPPPRPKTPYAATPVNSDPFTGVATPLATVPLSAHGGGSPTSSSGSPEPSEHVSAIDRPHTSELHSSSEEDDEEDREGEENMVDHVTSEEEEEEEDDEDREGEENMVDHVTSEEEEEEEDDDEDREGEKNMVDHVTSEEEEEEDEEDREEDFEGEISNGSEPLMNMIGDDEEGYNSSSEDEGDGPDTVIGGGEEGERLVDVEDDESETRPPTACDPPPPEVLEAARNGTPIPLSRGGSREAVAAVTIQTAFRSYRTRKEIREQMGEQPSPQIDPEEPVEPAVEPIVGPVEAAEAAQPEDYVAPLETEAEQDEAAVAIQAAFRDYRAQRELRENPPSATTISSTTVASPPVEGKGGGETPVAEAQGGGEAASPAPQTTNPPPMGTKHPLGEMVTREELMETKAALGMMVKNIQELQGTDAPPAEVSEKKLELARTAAHFKKLAAQFRVQNSAPAAQ